MNLVMFETAIRQDKEGRYCLNDLHKAAIASGLPVARKNPAEFFRTDMANNFVESVKKAGLLTTEEPVVPFTVRNGGKNPGTYAVRLVAQRYCGWLSSDFEVAVYSLIDKYSYEELQRKAIRENAREGYKDLTKALKYSFEVIGKIPKFYHYSNEADMINKIVLGMTAKQFRTEHGLNDDDQIRDHQTPFQIFSIEQLQRMDEQLINLGFTVEQRRNALHKRFDELSIRAIGLS